MDNYSMVFFEEPAPHPFFLKMKLEEKTGLEIFCNLVEVTIIKDSEITQSVTRVESISESITYSEKLFYDFSCKEIKFGWSVSYLNFHTIDDLTYLGRKIGYLNAVGLLIFGELGGTMRNFEGNKYPAHSCLPEYAYAPYETAKKMRKFPGNRKLS